VSSEPYAPPSVRSSPVVALHGAARAADRAALLRTPAVRAYLAELEGCLEDGVGWVDGTVGERAAATLAAGGKRLRPLLVLLAAPPPGRRRRELVRAGAAIELVHMASLVHDDVLDRAALRRGRPTVLATHGPVTAAATGDYLFARAFAVLAAAGSMPALALLAGCAVSLAQGEALQARQARRSETTPEEYLERCALKTGSLFSAACRLGGLLGGASSDAVDALGRFGHAVGIAFQVADDVLDCAGLPETTGKPLGTDLLDGTPTLPLVLAARREPAVAAAIAGGAEPGDLMGLLARVAASGALAEARETAYDQVRRAEAALDDLDLDHDTGALRAVARSVVDRDA
jgi:geranylgeranyl pyrophosphate synthase